MAKKGQVFRKYSPEFKLSVILDMRNTHLGYRETVRKYWNTKYRTEEALYLTTLRRWERKYLEEGEFGLMKDNRGRPSKDNKRGRPPKLNKQVENDLIKEKANTSHIKAKWVKLLQIYCKETLSLLFPTKN